MAATATTPSPVPRAPEFSATLLGVVVLAAVSVTEPVTTSVTELVALAVAVPVSVAEAVAQAKEEQNPLTGMA
ncbi:hypothetical protein GUR42_14915 [Staphylococcus aureus]|nr:hypothetical protein [Staphylococcus aureus]